MLDKFVSAFRDEIFLVTGIIERATASFSGSLELDQRPPTYFDARPPDERGFLRSRWGALTENSSALSQSPNDGEEANISSAVVKNGISVRMDRAYEIHCFQFSATEAAALKKMHDSL